MTNGLARHPYAWRARIGLIVPSTNTVNEPEFWAMAPQGVGVYTSRVLAEGPSDEHAFARMEDALELAAKQLSTAEVDILAYGCTTGSIFCSDEDLVKKMVEIAGVPAVTTAGSVVLALKQLGVRRIAVGTPYNDLLNQHEHEYLERAGFEVTKLSSVAPPPGERRRTIGRISPSAVRELAMSIDSSQAEALFLSCTNLATLPIINDLEQCLHKPVVTSNQATFWNCSRVLKLKVQCVNGGRLFMAGYSSNN